MSGLFLVGLYPLHFLLCSWVLYMTVLLRPLECWAQFPLCLPCVSGCPLQMLSKLPFLLGLLPERISLRTPISPQVPTPAAGAWYQRPPWHHPFLPWVMGTTPTLPTSARGCKLPGPTLATPMAASLDLTDLLQLPGGLSQVCSTGERFISLKF